MSRGSRWKEGKGGQENEEVLCVFAKHYVTNISTAPNSNSRRLTVGKKGKRGVTRGHLHD